MRFRPINTRREDKVVFKSYKGSFTEAVQSTRMESHVEVDTGQISKREPMSHAIKRGSNTKRLCFKRRCVQTRKYTDIVQLRC